MINDFIVSLLEQDLKDIFFRRSKKQDEFIVFSLTFKRVKSRKYLY